MPVQPKEEEAGSNLTDQVAKESKDSNASDHPLHDTSEKASIEHHQANPGIVLSANELPQKASKEELKKRSEELNKK